MSTDQHWVRWGEQDPYFAVITNDKFRAGQMDEAAREQFFASGRHHVRYVLDVCRKRVDPAFAPKRALDFGCGVGRIVLPLAQSVERVVGVDVSPGMLDEARRNCEACGVTNVELQLSDDALSALQGAFDLVHSCIVFQHIDVPRGRALFGKLLELMAPGGIAALQVTTGKAYHADTHGQPPAPPPVAPAPPPEPQAAATPGLLRGLLGLGAKPATDAPAPTGDPEMQMNPYNLSELAFLMQQAGVKRFHAEFTDHGGELGVFLFFSKPA